VEHALFAVPAEVSEMELREIGETNATGIKRVWLYQGGGSNEAVSEASLSLCRENGIETVYGLCPMMFFSPAGIHRVHYFFKKVFGNFPKAYSQM
jgi:hypothetical protein